VKRIALLAALAIATPAYAQDPWDVGVSEANQDKGNALFKEGNELFAQRAHAPALAKYKAAVAVWDHPMIRFNMAVTLIRLDRILEASVELEKALRYDAAPFTKELYQQALDYQALVQRQLSNIEVTVDQKDAQILLDGKPWFVGPGTKTMRVESGEHTIVAEKKEYLTLSRRLVVTGGKTAKESLTLVPLDRAVVVHYRHPRWIPWTITGVGAATALGGLAFWLLGRSHMDAFKDDFINECPSGCEAGLAAHPDLRDQQDRALLESKIGVSLMVAGGAIALTGTVWGLLNRPIRTSPRVEVAPTPGGAAASARWSF